MYPHLMKVFHLEQHAKTIMVIKKVSRAQLNTIYMNRGTAGAFPGQSIIHR